jgi:hypothetical protein
MYAFSPWNKLQGLFHFIIKKKKSMKQINKNIQHFSSNSFIVREQQTGYDEALSICNILQAINNMNDETIVTLFGSLDYDKISVKQFNLDIKTGKAFKDDIVTLYSYASVADHHILKVSLTAAKRDERKEIPLVNGSFVFYINNSVRLPYSVLS